MNKNLIVVKFENDPLQLVDHEGQPFVAMKPIVKSLKLDWRTQQAKLLENKHKFNYGLITIVAKDGKLREMGCIPLKKLNGWLFGINPKNIPNLVTRAKIEKYQEECFNILWMHWNQQQQTPEQQRIQQILKLLHDPVNTLSFEQISLSERLEQRRFVWREFQEFFGMKNNTWFLRSLLGVVNRRVLGMSAARFRVQVLGTNNRPNNLTKDFLPKPHQECIQQIMQELLEYFQARPNWTKLQVQEKVLELIKTKISKMERLIGRNLQELVFECIEQVRVYSQANDISPYEVIRNNLIQLNYDQLALERELRRFQLQLL